MKNLISFLMLFFCSLSITTSAQENSNVKTKKVVHEIGTMPLRLMYDVSQLRIKDFSWFVDPNIYYRRYKKGSNLSWVAMLNFEIGNESVDFEFYYQKYKHRNAVFTVAPRYTFGQKANWRLQPFVQPGLFVGSMNYMHSEHNILDTDLNTYITKNNGFVYGVDLTAGMQVLLSKKLILTLSAVLQYGQHHNNINRKDYAFNETYSEFFPIQIGIGYSFKSFL